MHVSWYISSVLLNYSAIDEETHLWLYRQSNHESASDRRKEMSPADIYPNCQKNIIYVCRQAIAELETYYSDTKQSGVRSIVDQYMMSKH